MLNSRKDICLGIRRPGLVAVTWMSAPGTPAAGILLEQGKGYAETV